MIFQSHVPVVYEGHGGQGIGDVEITQTFY